MCILIAWFQAQSDINPIKELKGRILKSGSPECVCHTQTHTHVTANCTSACSALSSNESPPALPFSGTRCVWETEGERDREHDVGKKKSSPRFGLCVTCLNQRSKWSVIHQQTQQLEVLMGLCVYTVQQLSPSLSLWASLSSQEDVYVYWCWVLSSTDRDTTSAATNRVEKIIEIYLNYVKISHFI